MNEIVGFTGTSEGMSQQQLIIVHQLLGEFKEWGASFAEHGMCVGADEQFDFMANAFRYVVTGHPGLTKQGRVWKRSVKCQCKKVEPAKPFLKRNADIVSIADVMIATPKEYEMVMIGSGTWATIRYARNADKPLIIVYPNGKTAQERLEKAFDTEKVAYLQANFRTA